MGSHNIICTYIPIYAYTLRINTSRQLNSFNFFLPPVPHTLFCNIPTRCVHARKCKRYFVVCKQNLFYFFVFLESICMWSFLHENGTHSECILFPIAKFRLRKSTTKKNVQLISLKSSHVKENCKWMLYMREILSWKKSNNEKKNQTCRRENQLTATKMVFYAHFLPLMLHSRFYFLLNTKISFALEQFR